MSAARAMAIPGAAAPVAGKARRLPLPEVSISDDGEVRHLHLGTPWIQGSMRLAAPFALELEYVQRMMCWLLFVEPGSVGARQAMQLGLGAGALTKCCVKTLRLRRTTAVELNAQVVAACRRYFRLPAESARFALVQGDAADEVRLRRYHGSVDALQVDLYDQDAAAPVLDSADFYADCRRALTDDGCLTVNLFGRRASFARSARHLADAFGADALWAFKPTREGNTVVLAQRRAALPGRGVLAARAAEIEARWGLPAKGWLRSFKPFAPPPVALP